MAMTRTIRERPIKRGASLYPMTVYDHPERGKIIMHGREDFEARSAEDGHIQHCETRQEALAAIDSYIHAQLLRDFRKG